MSLDIAALYLSIDHSTLLRLALEYRVEPVDVGLGEARWRKADMDRLARRLPAIPALPTPQKADRRSISDADIDKLAAAVAVRISVNQPRGTAELFSVKEAGRMLGLGRSTIYRLISEGQLETRHIGRRTLITKEAIERLQAGVSG